MDKKIRNPNIETRNNFEIPMAQFSKQDLDSCMFDFENVFLTF